MVKPPSSETIAASLTVPERVLLFCVASDTEWRRASIKHTTAQRLLLRGLIGRDQAALRFVLTDQGRAVFEVLLSKSGLRS
jgi:hypothetical protein